MNILLRNGVDLEDLGFLPSFIHDNDKRPVKEQFNERYRYGGGWQPFGDNKWRVLKGEWLVYPGDPALRPIAEIRHREERVVIYPHAIVRIVQPDGSHEIARMD